MQPLYKVIMLLVCSNVFMAFAWYSHLKSLSHKPLWIAIFVSWMVALCEYSFMIPANRLGFSQANLTLGQLKILQEAITMLVFIPFAIFYMKQPLTLNFLWASLCLAGAIYFIFR